MPLVKNLLLRGGGLMSAKNVPIKNSIEMTVAFVALNHTSMPLYRLIAECDRLRKDRVAVSRPPAANPTASSSKQSRKDRKHRPSWRQSMQELEERHGRS